MPDQQRQPWITPFELDQGCILNGTPGAPSAAR
jgi:hypothetical protein